MSYNEVILIGNLTRDPELRYLASGTAVAQFSLAVNRRWRDAAGNDKEEVSFIDCTAFGKTAELISQYFKKGAPMMVNGRLRQDSWDDKSTGQKRSKLGVVVEELTFLPRAQATVAPAPQAAPAASPGPAAAAPAAADPSADDDVPF
jgi:single-strand DNA-binding protein